jgi:hypothetical protein
MTNTIIISCIINTTNPTAKLGFEAWIDDQKFVDIDHVSGEEKISMEISDADGEHELQFVMKNKQPEHTKIDQDGNIVSDSTLTVSDVAFDEIQLGAMVGKLAVYTHDFNGTGKTTQDEFHGVMGCNGAVAIKFTTPIYMWLLEHM